jgi:hypothetical protein
MVLGLGRNSEGKSEPERVEKEISVEGGKKNVPPTTGVSSEKDGLVNATGVGGRPKKPKGEACNSSEAEKVLRTIVASGGLELKNDFFALRRLSCVFWRLLPQA